MQSAIRGYPLLVTDVPYHPGQHQSEERSAIVKAKSLAVMAVIALVVVVGYDQYKARKGN